MMCNLLRFSLFCFLFIPPFYLMAKNSITVVTEEWPPYNYTNSDGEFVGLATDVLKEVLHEANIDYQIKVLSWHRAYKLAQESSHTLIYTIYKADNRLAQFQWICPLVITSGLNIYALKSRDDIHLSTLNDAKNYSVATTSRSVTHDYLILKGFEEGNNLDIGTDELANIRKLFKGRVDLIIQDEKPFKLRLRNAGLSFAKIKKVLPLFPEQENRSCMAMSLTTPKPLVDKIRKALNTVTIRRQEKTK